MNNVPFLCTKVFQKRGHYSRGDIIQGRTLFKEGHYLRKYGMWINLVILPRLKIPNKTEKAFRPRTTDFWAWVDNFADKFWGIWGIFGQFIRTHFGTVSPLSIFSINQGLLELIRRNFSSPSINQPLFLQKNYPNPKYLFGIGIWIWAANNWGFSHRVSVVRESTLW